MKDLIKYLKYFFVSSLLIIACTNKDFKNEISMKEDIVTPMTREDSIISLAEELNIDFDKKDDITLVLGRILFQKNKLITKLDSLNERAYLMEVMVYEFKKKDDDKIKKELIFQINKIKNELEKIKQFAREKEIVKKEELVIHEEKITIDIKTFEDLKPGNYATRLDSKHIIRVFVTPERQIIVSDPIIDSTTVFTGSSKVSFRMAKELQQIRENFKKSQQ